MSEMHIADITIDPRWRRRDMGKLRDLQRSIRDHGLQRPVPVTADGTLIAGERRLKACRNLGWDSIPVAVAADNEHALKLLIAEHEDTGAGHKPRLVSELVLLGLQVEELERDQARRRQLDGCAHRPATEPRRQSRDFAADTVGLSRHYYIQIRRIAFASLGLETISGGYERRPITAESARQARQALDVIDRILGGEKIDHVGPTGRRSLLTVNAVYQRWVAENIPAGQNAIQKNSDCNVEVVAETAPQPGPAQVQRGQREALAKGLATLTGLCHGLASINSIDPAVTREEAASFERDLSNASRTLRGLHNKIKEYGNGIA